MYFEFTYRQPISVYEFETDYVYEDGDDDLVSYQVLYTNINSVFTKINHEEQGDWHSTGYSTAVTLII